MSTEPSQLQQMKPYLILSGILLVLVLVVVLWPTSDSNLGDESTNNNSDSQAELVVEAAEPINDPNANITDMVKPEAFEPVPTPVGVTIGDENEVDELKAKEIVVDVPVDISDATVKSALMDVIKSPTFGKLLVNDRLLDKFVINVHNLSNQDMSPKDALLLPPQAEFKTYKQADKTFMDSNGYNRYSPYVSVLESIDTAELLDVFAAYEDTVKEKFAEISRPNENFDRALIDAIDVLLSTPEVSYPLEVYSESVVYKFKDERIENLSGPQKQLIRTGPENMKRIKSALRSIKTALEEQQP